MRFMILIKADAASEAGTMPSERVVAEMGQFNEALLKAGVLQAGEGLQPSSKGARVMFDGEQRRVEHGPFDIGTGGLLAGFWIWQYASLEDAIDWARRWGGIHSVMDNTVNRQQPSAARYGSTDATVVSPGKRSVSIALPAALMCPQPQASSINTGR